MLIQLLRRVMNLMMIIIHYMSSNSVLLAACPLVEGKFHPHVEHKIHTFLEHKVRAPLECNRILPVKIPRVTKPAVDVLWRVIQTPILQPFLAGKMTPIDGFPGSSHWKFFYLFIELSSHNLLCTLNCMLERHFYNSREEWLKNC